QAVPVPGIGGGEGGGNHDRGDGEQRPGVHGEAPWDRHKARPCATTKQPGCRAGNERATALFFRLRGRMSPANVLGGGRMLERLALWADAHTPNAIRV